MTLLPLALAAALASGLALDRNVSDGFDLGPRLEVIADTAGTLTLDDVRADPGFLSKRDSQILHFPFGTPGVWGRFVVDDADGEDWLVQANFPRPSLLELYVFENDARIRSASDSLQGALKRGVGRLNTFVPLASVCSAYPCEVWFRFEGHPLRIDLQLVTADRFERQQLARMMGSGLYFGILLALLAYHLVLGFSLRERRFLLYAAFLACLGAHVAVRQGMFPAFIWRLSPTFFEQGAAYAMTVVVTLAFTRAFLSTPRVLPRTDRWLRWGIHLAFAFAAVLMLEIRVLGVRMLPMVFVLGVLAIASVLFSAWQAWRAGERSALPFLIAMALLVASSTSATLQALGVVQAKRWMGVALGVSSAAQMMLFALALAARFRELRDAKERSERGLLERTLAYERGLKQMQDRSYASLLEAVEGERARLSRELHDGLGHSLLVVKSGIRLLLRRVTTLDEDTRERLESLSSAAQGCIDETRSLARSLSPARVEQLGLLGALEAMCSESSRAANVPVTIDTDASPADLDSLLGDRSVHVFRVAQEAVQNALKHANPANVRLAIALDDRELRLRIHDDGTGFSPESPPGTLGLHGMSERARILKGTLVMESTPGEGTRVELRFPLQTESNTSSGDRLEWNRMEVAS